MDTHTAKAIRANLQDKVSMGDPVALQMYRRAWAIGLTVFGICAAMTGAAIYVRKRKAGCVDCGH